MFNRIVQAVLIWGFRVFYRLARRRPRPAPSPDSVHNILLISTTGLGDTIISTPAIAAVRRTWPQARVVGLFHRRWASLFGACPDVDEVLAYPGKFKKVRPLIRRLRAIRPDLALILHGNDPDIVPLAYLSGARFIAGWAASRFSFLLDRPVALADRKRPLIERRLDVVRSVAGPLDGNGEILYVPSGKKDWAASYWTDRGGASNHRLVVLNPGGSLQAKRWPDGHWRDLIQRLSGTPGLTVALFGSEAERSLMESLREDASVPDIPVVAGQDILESAALLARADLLVGPDSGLGHMAAALEVPVLLLFGPDNPAVSGPYRNRAPYAVLQRSVETCPDIGACRKKECLDNRCLTEITPTAVLDAMEKQFGFSLDSRPIIP